MKIKKKLIKRIGAVLCALLVFVSGFGFSVPFYASIDFDYALPDVVYGYKYYSLLEWKVGELRLLVSDEPLSFYTTTEGGQGFGDASMSINWRSFWTKDGVTWKEGIGGSSGYAGFNLNENSVILRTNHLSCLLTYDFVVPLEIDLPPLPCGSDDKYFISYRPDEEFYVLCVYDGGVFLNCDDTHSYTEYENPCLCVHGTYVSYRFYPNEDAFVWQKRTTVDEFSFAHLNSKEPWKLVATSEPIMVDGYGELFTECINYNFSFLPPAEYSSALGYLQNVSRKSTYIRGALYNYDDESLTYHWYHDLTSTTGIDLTNGNYKIRHYVSNATVKGYEKADIVEMSEKYLMAEYDASQGYFSYLQKDYLEKIENLGYVEPSWIDVYLRGYFTLQHHYFQIVDTSTNEVGGYLHFYPKDASGDSFGVELEYEGLDDKFEVDEDGPSGFIDTPTGSGTTVEDALENADQPKLDDLEELKPLFESLQGFTSQIVDVTSGVGALLGSLPAWLLTLFGLSFAMLFIIILFKVIRG